MLYENLEWVRLGDAIERYQDDRLAVFEPAVRILHADELWTVDGRDAVLGRSAGHDFVKRYGLLAEVGLEFPSVGARLGEKLPANRHHQERRQG